MSVVGIHIDKSAHEPPQSQPRVARRRLFRQFSKDKSTQTWAATVRLNISVEFLQP